ncbi:nucleoside phosphorylase domain-containing protein [Aspergillus filifer]
MAPLTHDDYTVAWICALPLEAAAARAMLDKTHAPLPQITDPNAYELGELNGHHIVIAYLPNGVYGTVSAATVISRMRLTFPRLQFGLMVGIGGGVPSQSNDIRLGDVVVSKPGERHGGVIQYDYGKAVQGGRFEPTGILNQPPQAILTHMSQLQAKQMTCGDNAMSKLVSEVLERNPNMNEIFSPPKQSTDYLFHSSYHHAEKDSNCENTSHAMVEQSFLKIAQILGLCEGKPADIKEQIQTYLSSERAGKWLLIFDNADDAEMWLSDHDRTPALEDILPQSEQGRILFTTRNWELAVDLTHSNMISIPDVDKGAARSIFESLLVQKSMLEDDSIVVALLEQLAFLPLAIAQAAAYINKKRLDLATYLNLLLHEEDAAHVSTRAMSHNPFFPLNLPKKRVLML